jgi:hypothetical protein
MKICDVCTTYVSKIEASIPQIQSEDCHCVADVLDDELKRRYSISEIEKMSDVKLLYVLSGIIKDQAYYFEIIDCTVQTN